MTAAIIADMSNFTVTAHQRRCDLGFLYITQDGIDLESVIVLTVCCHHVLYSPATYSSDLVESFPVTWTYLLRTPT